MFIEDHQSPITSLKPLNFALWFTLAFQSGTLNVGGFLTCQRFVTHVTGFATHFGVDLASGLFLDALSMLMVPVFFLFGCMCSALIIDRRKYLQKKPHYTFAFLFTGIILTLITILGQTHLLGEFGHISNSLIVFLLLATLAFLSGMQNSLISLASGLLVRTTHLTGVTTDLGVGVMRMFYPNTTPSQRMNELKMNLLRFGIIFSFIFGSLIGGITFYRWKFLGFIVPSLTSFTLAYYSWNLNQHKSSNLPYGVPS